MWERGKRSQKSSIKSVILQSTTSTRKIFTRDAMLARVLAVIACPSARPSHAGTVRKWLSVRSRKQRHVIAQGLQFSGVNSRWWATQFPLKFALKVTNLSIKL